jgi:DNA-binding NarL/FixJ family response regulator
MRPEAVCIRVLIADDHALLRDGLQAVMAPLDDIAVVGTAADGDEAVEAYAELLPDVVVLDVEMPGVDGLSALATLRARHPACRVLMFSSFTGDARIVRALSLGAAGYVLKTSPKVAVIHAIRQVAAGRQVLSPEVSDQLDSIDARPLLHPREVACLALASQGFATKEIAARLGVPVDTVKTRLKAAFAKLGVKDRVHAVTVAIARGYL